MGTPGYLPQVALAVAYPGCGGHRGSVECEEVNLSSKKCGSVLSPKDLPHHWDYCAYELVKEGVWPLLTPEPCEQLEGGRQIYLMDPATKERKATALRDIIKTCRQAGEWSEVVHQAWLGFFLVMLSALFWYTPGPGISQKSLYCLVPGTTWYWHHEIYKAA